MLCVHDIVYNICAQENVIWKRGKIKHVDDHYVEQGGSKIAKQYIFIQQRKQTKKNRIFFR